MFIIFGICNQSWKQVLSNIDIRCPGFQLCFEGMGVNMPPIPQHVVGKCWCQNPWNFNGLSIYPIRPESFCFTWSNHKIETCTISSSELGIRLGSALRESCVLVEGLRPNPLGSGRSGAAEKNIDYAGYIWVKSSWTNNWPSWPSSTSMIDLPNAGDQREPEFGPFLNNVLDDIASGDPWSLYFFLLGSPFE